MSFRKIRPSSGENSGSTSNPSQSTSESTGSDPRRVRSEKEVDAGGTTTIKRRRVPDSVTRNACLNCKKARAKCDGKKPCKRCASRIETSECIYEVHIKHAKEELVKQIKELMTKEHLTEQILQALSTDEQIPEILARLKNGETYESIVSWLGRSPIEALEGLSPRESQSQFSTVDTSDHEMGGITGPFRWTMVTSDINVLDHLFQLYFAWVHPVHTLFSEGRFVDSYKRQSNVYCSSILVNAICAMACHLHSASDTDDLDYEQLGREFSDAVRLNMDGEDRRITTIQTFAVMFLVGAARSEGLRASSYLRIATNNLSWMVHLNIEGFQEVWKNTARGLRNLNGSVVLPNLLLHTNALSEWAQVTFQVPPAMRIGPQEGIEDNDDTLDSAKWYFYRFVNDQCPAWPGLLATTNRHRLKLGTIISDVTTMMYNPQGQHLTARSVLEFYGRFLAWRRDLPSSIGNIENNRSQALPHVLSLHILYEHSVVHLLRPLLDLANFPTSTIEEIIWNHAQRGLFLLDQHYRTQYTCRYQPVLQMFSILHLVDVVARFFPGGVEGSSKDGPDAIFFGLDALKQSRAGFSVTGPFREMLRKTANVCSIRLPKNKEDHAGLFRPSSSTQVYRMDDMIDACTRQSYVQPVDEIHKRYQSTFAADWAFEGANMGLLEPPSAARRLGVPSEEERGAQSLMQIRNLLNSS